MGGGGAGELGRKKTDKFPTPDSYFLDVILEYNIG
jgi:hypothetical protein